MKHSTWSTFLDVLADEVLISVSRHSTYDLSTDINPLSGLFSAAVAALVAVPVQDLKPNSLDTSASYLANIYQILANSNGPYNPASSILPDPTAPFSPPNSAM